MNYERVILLVVNIGIGSKKIMAPFQNQIMNIAIVGRKHFF